MTAPDHASRWAARAATEVLAARRDDRRVGPMLGGAQAGVDPDPIVAAVVAHRLVPLVAPNATALGAPDAVVEGLTAAHRRWTRRGLGAAADTARVSALLAGGPIAHLVCKGAALDALLGHPPGTRGPGDVDVWVAPHDVAAAVDTLASTGWPRRATLAHYPSPGDGWSWDLLLWGGKELPHDGTSAASVDLHWRLTNGRRHLSFGLRDALATDTTVAIAGAEVPTLAPLHALEHLAAHGRKEAWPYLRQLVDIAELVALVGEEPAARLAEQHPEVAAALGVAAHLAPWLRALVRLDRRTERLCTEAWRGCLGLDRRYHVRMALTGPDAWRASLRHEWWTFRSAPDGRSRFGYATRLALWAATHAPRRGPAGYPTAARGFE